MELSALVCKAVNTYSGRTWFEFQSEHQLILGFCRSFRPSGNSGIEPRLGRNRFRPNPIQLIIYQTAYHSIQCNVAADSVVKQASKKKTIISSAMPQLL
jgi:hypothetical protein